MAVVAGLVAVVVVVAVVAAVVVLSSGTLRDRGSSIARKQKSGSRVPAVYN